MAHYNAPHVIIMHGTLNFPSSLTSHAAHCNAPYITAVICVHGIAPDSKV